jgi:HEAT repeat protein
VSRAAPLPAVALAALAACDGAGPPLPPLALAPAQAACEAVVAAAPARPAAPRLAELGELVDAAFAPGLADERTAGRARRALLEAQDAPFALEAALLHADPTVRGQAAWAVATTRAFGALPALVLRLKYETDARARLWVGAALGQLGNGAGLGALRDALAAAATADEAGDATLELLRERGRAIAAAPSWDDLRAALAQLEQDWRRTGAPLHGLERTPRQAAALRAAIAERLLATEGFQLRQVDDARFVLARLGTEPLDLLATALGAQELYLRNHALEVIAALGAPARALAPRVLPLLGDRTSAPFALAALGALGATEALPHVLARLRDEDPEVRAAAAEALGGLPGAGVTGALRARLRLAGELLDVKVRAAASLARLEGGGEGLAFLQARQRAGDYHAPTLAEQLAKAAAAGTAPDRR